MAVPVQKRRNNHEKLLAFLLVLTAVLTLSACGKKPSEGGTEGNGAGQGCTVGTVKDEKILGESVACKVTSEGKIVMSVRTSAEIKRHSGWIGICPMGVYLTEEAADEADVYYQYFDSSYEKEWFDGIYTFVPDQNMITPGTYTMVLCDDDDSGSVIGEWIFDMRKNGSIEIGFDDAWLKGAGESRNPGNFDSPADEVASWFTFNEYDEEWAEFLFDGYYLEDDTAQGGEIYYTLMVCPAGDYATYSAAMDAHVGDYSSVLEKCPYVFSIDQSGIAKGKYTMVLAKHDGGSGSVEIAFGVEKTSDTKWKFDFSDVKCPKLESKYAK